MNNREPTLRWLKNPQDLRNGGSFPRILIPALFRDGPHFGSELSVSWLIWSHVLRQQENHLLVAMRGEWPVRREYLKMPEGVRNQILSEAEKYYFYRHHR